MEQLHQLYPSDYIRDTYDQLVTRATSDDSFFKVSVIHVQVLLAVVTLFITFKTLRIIYLFKNVYDAFQKNSQRKLKEMLIQKNSTKTVCRPKTVLSPCLRLMEVYVNMIVMIIATTITASIAGLYILGLFTTTAIFFFLLALSTKLQ